MTAVPVVVVGHSRILSEPDADQGGREDSSALPQQRTNNNSSAQASRGYEDIPERYESMTATLQITAPAGLTSTSKS